MQITYDSGDISESSSQCGQNKSLVLENQNILIQDYSKLLNSGDHSDITFMVNSKEVMAHKIILSGACHFLTYRVVASAYLKLQVFSQSFKLQTCNPVFVSSIFSSFCFADLLYFFCADLSTFLVVVNASISGLRAFIYFYDNNPVIVLRTIVCLGSFRFWGPFFYVIQICMF